MAHTRADRVKLPDDPEEIRALFWKRMRERDKAHNPHMTSDEDTTPKEDRTDRKPQSIPSMQAKRQNKPYRVIHLTEEEARAMKEGKLTVEEVKVRDPLRDDDIPRARKMAKPRSRQETGHEAHVSQAHMRGPNETPTGAGKVASTDTSRTGSTTRIRRDPTGANADTSRKEFQRPNAPCHPQARAG